MNSEVSEKNGETLPRGPLGFLECSSVLGTMNLQGQGCSPVAPSPGLSLQGLPQRSFLCLLACSLTSLCLGTTHTALHQPPTLKCEVLPIPTTWHHGTIANTDNCKFCSIDSGLFATSLFILLRHIQQLIHYRACETQRLYLLIFSYLNLIHRELCHLCLYDYDYFKVIFQVKISKLGPGR